MSALKLIWLFILPWSFQVHEFHSSIAEAEYKKDLETVQVSLRVFTDDLNLALKNQTSTDFKEDFQSKEAQEAIQSYLLRHFAFVSKNKDVRVANYLGCEVELDASWLYLEILDVQKPSEYQIYNVILIDEFDDQTNVVNIIEPGRRKSLIFTKDTRTLAYPFDD